MKLYKGTKNMAKFKKAENISGKYKAIMIQDGNFVDTETGDIIDMVNDLSKVYGNNVFDISVTSKSEEDVEIVS